MLERPINRTPARRMRLSRKNATAAMPQIIASMDAQKAQETGYAPRSGRLLSVTAAGSDNGTATSRHNATSPSHWKTKVRRLGRFMVGTQGPRVAWSVKMVLAWTL
jgi:hypothetical protein